MNKANYRKEYKAKRKTLSKEEIDTRSIAIANHVLHHFELVGKHIHTFVSIDGKKEINTRFLVNQLFAIDCKVSTSITHLSPDYLEHTRIYSHTKYGFDSFGIPTPLTFESVKETDFDLIIVPLLCVDTQGNRIGYGKGFYDRFLNNCRTDCIFIGLSLFEPVDTLFETEPWDVQLHHCVTPEGVKTFSNK
jgi:5-formyltetrahydrofolate cyclo-ligase